MQVATMETADASPLIIFTFSTFLQLFAQSFAEEISPAGRQFTLTLSTIFPHRCDCPLDDKTIMSGVLLLQVSFPAGEPPAQKQPASTLHSLLQPSPLMLLPSSQARINLFSSPHISEHSPDGEEVKPDEQARQESQLMHLLQPEEQGRQRSCCWSQYVPLGQEGVDVAVVSEPDEEEEEEDEEEDEEDDVVVVVVVGGAGAGTATHFPPSQTSPAKHVTHVARLQQELGGQVATHFPLQLIVQPTHCPQGPPMRKKQLQFKQQKLLDEVKVKFPLTNPPPIPNPPLLLLVMNPLNPWKATLLLLTPIGGVKIRLEVGRYMLQTQFPATRFWMLGSQAMQEMKMEWTCVAVVDCRRRLIPPFETALTKTYTQNGVKQEELTAIELISKPFRKVKTEVKAVDWLLRGMKAAMVFPELHEERDPVSIWQQPASTWADPSARKEKVSLLHCVYPHWVRTTKGITPLLSEFTALIEKKRLGLY